MQRKVLQSACLFALLVIGVGAAGAGVGQGAAAGWGTALDGSPVRELAPRREKIVVLFFVATDCPISNRGFPEMRRLEDQFSPRGVRFWFVYPNADERPAQIAAHQRAFAGGENVVRDPDGVLTTLSHAVATPEMVVLVSEAGGAGWRPVYAGRIDDRFVRLGLERPLVTRHFGEEALEALLAGRQPAPATGAPVGCAIMNAKAGSERR